jgi:hypothetical protein
MNTLGLWLGLLLVLLLASTLPGQQKSPAPISNSLNGFEKQYTSFFKAWEKTDNPFRAYKAENEQELVERFRAFAIPEHRFTDVFGPQQGETFAKQYSEVFKAFEFSTNREFLTALGEDTAQVKTERLIAGNADLQAYAQPFLVPLPTVQLFRVMHFTAVRSIMCADCGDTYLGRQYSHSYVESFIYVDGAFRFVGSCDCPFWRSCSTNDPVFAGQLVKQVRPVDSKTSKPGRAQQTN